MADFSQLLYGEAQPTLAPTGFRTPGQGLPGQIRDKALDRAAELAQKKLDASYEVLNKGSNNLSLLNKFIDLNTQNRTGALYEGSFSSLMPDSFRGDAEKVMQSITSEIAPNKRVEGSGTTSDKDISLYLESLPSISKGGEANRQIRDLYQKQYDRAKAKVDFLQSYYDQYGHLNGAEKIWSTQNPPAQYGKSKSGWSIRPVTSVQSGE
jgi:hypothetical protein